MLDFIDNPRDLRVLALSQYEDDILVEVAAVVAVRTKLRSQFAAHLLLQEESLASATSEEKRKRLQEDIDLFKRLRDSLELDLEGDAEWDRCRDMVSKRRQLTEQTLLNELKKRVSVPINSSTTTEGEEG